MVCPAVCNCLPDWFPVGVLVSHKGVIKFSGFFLTLRAGFPAESKFFLFSQGGDAKGAGCEVQFFSLPKGGEHSKALIFLKQKGRRTARGGFFLKPEGRRF